MKPFTDEEFAVIENAIERGEECYSAFNKLAVVLGIDFRFYGVELHDAIKFLKGARDYQLKED